VSARTSCSALVPLLLLVGTARADDEPQRFFLHANVSLNAFTYNAALGSSPAQELTPEKRLSFGQQVGFGYYVLPYLRVQLTLQLNESSYGLPAHTSAFTTAGFIPWLVFTTHGFYVGAGPLLWARAYSKNDFEAGIYVATGYVFAMPHHFGIGLGVQMPITLDERKTIQISPIMTGTYRF
jgi:hypothetical protein